METLTIPYSTLWFDYNVSDGTYTPKQLRAAGLVMRRERMRSYVLTWPGGDPRPPASALRVTGSPGKWSIVRQEVE